MAQADYIPAGRTSRIVRGSSEIQIQTEYACRPNPRLTTSLFDSGRLIHKIEQELPRPIASFEDKLRVENILRRQHTDVLKIISDKKNLLAFLKNDRKSPAVENRSVRERLSGIKGVEKVYHLDNDGNFLSEGISEEFRKNFSLVFRSLNEIVNIYDQLPGGERQKGIYEIEKRRLYFASFGRECYFILLNPRGAGEDFEAVLRSVLDETAPKKDL